MGWSIPTSPPSRSNCNGLPRHHSHHAVGKYVTYNTPTGVLGAVATGVDVPAGFAILPGAFVERFASASPGLAIISLGTNPTPHVGGA